MTPEHKEELRESVLTLLKNSNVKPNSVKGREMAYSFYVGVLTTQRLNGIEPDAYLTICLMSGRIDDLLKEPKS